MTTEGIELAAGPSSATPGAARRDRDALKFITVDLSSLEQRFSQVFERLDTMETVLRKSLAPGGSNTRSTPDISAELAASINDLVGFSETKTSSSSPTKAVTTTTFDPASLAKEFEALRAAQLRLRVDHELSQSSVKLELEHLRHGMEALPQQSDLHDARTEIEVLLSSTLKTQREDQEALQHGVTRSLAEREVAENQWKAQFESAVHARLQDVWSALAVAQESAQQDTTQLQQDMGLMDAQTRDMKAAVASATELVSKMDARLVAREEDGVSVEHELTQLHALLKQGNVRALAMDTARQNDLAALTKRIDMGEVRHDQEQATFLRFVDDVQRQLSGHADNLLTLDGTLEQHQEKLQVQDTTLTNHSGELERHQEHLCKSDARQGALDGRVMQQEKQSVALTGALQELEHDLGKRVTELRVLLDRGSADRAAIKRASTETSFAVQETQQLLQAVSKMASTTELSLSRTAAEIPKLHTQASTHGSHIAKSRQHIAELTVALEEERHRLQLLTDTTEKERLATVARFAETLRRDDSAQQAIEATNTTMQQIRHALQEGITHNGKLIHQLNTLVDALAITESATEMDDKLGRFALQCAELALKLEQFAAAPGNHGSNGYGTTSSSSNGGGGASGGSASEASMASTTGTSGAREETRAELAILLSKIIRFLGAGVAIDQNKYFLTARRLVAPSAGSSEGMRSSSSSSSSTGSGALLVEIPVHRILDGFRAAKVTLFATKMRTFVDQLRPVARTVKHVHAFRDQLDKRIRFVLTFGLANLFPNGARPKNPQRRDGQLGTCIACDRPMDPADDDDPEQAERAAELADRDLRSYTRNASERWETTHHHPRAQPQALGEDPEREAVEEQRMRRNKVGGGSAVTHKIDTRTPVRGRVGGKPSGMAAVVDTNHGSGHHPPGTTEYIYRAGFRLPRPSTAGASTALTPTDWALTSLIMHGDWTEDMTEGQATKMRPSSTSQEGVGVAACLERVGLVGRHQGHGSTVAIPTTKVPQSRPQTAPHRAKSLPQLEVVGALEQGDE